MKAAITHMTLIWKDWGLFSLVSMAGAIEGLYGLSVVAKSLSPMAYSEWTVLLALMTVMGAVSQWGFKTGYMQMVVDQISRPRQLQNLRSGVFFLSLTGFVSGCFISILLYQVSLFDQWETVAPLFVMPVLMASNNAQILLVSDLRITSKVHFLSLLTMLRVPIFLGLIYVINDLSSNGLLVIFSVQTIVSLLMTATLLSFIKVPIYFNWRSSFIAYSFNLGAPVMLGLLLKYASDAVVALSIRWAVPHEIAVQYGQSMRLLEPYNALFFSAFVMAWGPNIFLIIRKLNAQINILKKIIQVAFGILILGILGAYASAYVIRYWIPELSEVSLSGVIIWMVVLRMAAFAALSPSQFGFVVIRNYKTTAYLHLFEFVLTLTAYGTLILLQHYFFAMVVAALIPWLIVTINYFLSVNLIAQHDR